MKLWYACKQNAVRTTTLSNILHFTLQPLAQTSPRLIYTARDDANRLYTLGLGVNGFNGYAAVFDPETLRPLYSQTFLGYRLHADELKKHLQKVADEMAVTTTHRGEPTT